MTTSLPPAPRRAPVLRATSVLAAVLGLILGLGAIAVSGVGSASAAEVPAQWTWGANDFGVLGTGDDDTVVDPVVVPTPPGSTVPWSDMDTLADHALAIDADGLVWAWGYNLWGQLGQDPATVPQTTTPLRVAGLPSGRFVRVAAGANWSLALHEDGRLFAWGSNEVGQFGNGTQSGPNDAGFVPVQVTLPTGVGVESIQAGYDFGYARLADGTDVVWGGNAFGQLGDGTTALALTPVALTAPGGGSFQAVSVGVQASAGVTADGSWYSWGENVLGQAAIGDYDPVLRRVQPQSILTPTPMHLPEGSTYTRVALGEDCGVGLAEDGRVHAWGNNEFGQHGDGTRRNEDRARPAAVHLPDGLRIIDVQVSLSAAAVLVDDGRVFAWGDPISGIFGPAGSSEPQLAPIVVPFTVDHPVSAMRVSPVGVFATAAAETPEITTTVLPAMTPSDAYAARIETTGSPIISVFVSAGSLPDGFSLAPDGTLSGTTAATGPFSFTVTAVSGAGATSRLLELDASGGGAPSAGGTELAATGPFEAGLLAAVGLALLGIGAALGALAWRSARITR